MQKSDRISPWFGLIDLPNRGLLIPFSIWRGNKNIGLFGIDVKSMNPAKHVLDLCSWSHYRGTGGVAFDGFQIAIAQMRFNEAGSPVFAGGYEDCSPLFPFPKEFSAGVTKDTFAFVYASTPKVFVVSRTNDYRKAGETLGANTLWVRVQSTGIWRTIVVPGQAPAVRAFGQRLAIAVRSPWGDRERSVKGTLSNPTEYQRYEESDFEYPGTLLVYDTVDGRRWQIDTGHSDSEILLIRGDELYYRIHTKLIRARLDARGVVKTEQVIDDRPEIAEMHWAFFGPAWSENETLTGKGKAKEAAAKSPPPPIDPKIVTEMPPGVYFRFGFGALRTMLGKDLPDVIVRNGLQTWFLPSERIPGSAEYYVGPIDDDDVVERLEQEFLAAEMRLVKKVFPPPK